MTTSSEMAKNSEATAISRDKISAPLRYILNLKPELIKVFHQGPGRENNPDRKKIKKLSKSVIEYDPYHGPSDRDVLRKGNCTQAISIYILNVLPHKQRRSALLDIYRTLNDDGVAYIAVRSKSDIETSRRDTWISHEQGYIVPRGESSNFQKGFSAKELEQELYRDFSYVEVFDRSHFILGVAEK